MLPLISESQSIESKESARRSGTSGILPLFAMIAANLRHRMMIWKANWL